MALPLYEILTIAAATAVSYAATNLDNLMVAVLLLGGNRSQPIAVVAGVITAGIIVLTVCALGVFLRTMVDDRLIGYLGLLPIALGFRELLRRKSAAAEPAVASPAGEGAISVWLGATALLLANSADTIAVFLPLLAESKADVLPLAAVSFVGTAAVWGMLAWALASRPWLAEGLERHGSRLLPWVMIGIGVYILLDTATDSLS